MAGEVFIFLVESSQLALAVEMPLHVGDVRVIGAVALQFVEHLQKHRQDRLSAGLGVGSTVDVEQDHVGMAVDGFLYVGEHQLIADLFLEELHRLLGVSGMLVLQISQHIAQDLNEVRFAGAKEARHPNAGLARNIDVFRVVDAFAVGPKELPNVAVEFTGHHELIQFLPDRGFIRLIGFHHTVDRSEDVLGEQLSDFHQPRSYGISRKAR